MTIFEISWYIIVREMKNQSSRWSRRVKTYYALDRFFLSLAFNF